MRTATSKLTRKYQATIPKSVREVLHLQAGDAIAFDFEGETIRVRKARMAFTDAPTAQTTKAEGAGFAGPVMPCILLQAFPNTRENQTIPTATLATAATSTAQ